MNIIIHSGTEGTLEKAGAALDHMVRERGGKPLLMLLSGGSSLALLDFISDDGMRGGVTFGMLDDRYSFDETVNSYSIVERSPFFRRALDAGADFLVSRPEPVESLEAYALHYELEVKKWLALYPDGIVRATVGVGPDGHTSGILPHPEDPEKFDRLFNGESLVVGYDVGNKNPHRFRMTSTFTLMRRFDRVLTYMQGENKRDALRKVLADEGTLPETPGRILRELERVDLYTDVRV